MKENESGERRPFDRLAEKLDRFIPSTIVESGDADRLRRARLLVGGSYLLAANAILFIPPTLYVEGASANALVLLFGAVTVLSAPAVLRRSGSMGLSATLCLSAVALTVWSGAWMSGGFEGSTLRLVAIVPLIATFLVNARLGFGFAVVMGVSIECFYYLDLGGYPFPEPPQPEAEQWFSAQAAVVELGFVAFFAWLFEANRRQTHDELKGSEAKLRESLAQSQTILDNMADGLAFFDAESRLVARNPALIALLGGESGVPKQLRDLAARAIQSHELERLELELPGERMGSAVASPIVSGEELGGINGTVVLVRDITLEKEIDRMKTDFIASVSHELRTPLTSILGFTKLTKNKLEAHVFPHAPEGDRRAKKAVETARGNLDVVLIEGDRLTALINNVLDISKMEAGRMDWKMAPFEASLLVDRAVAATSALFDENGPEVRVEIEDDLPTLEGDLNRLQQVLINLISNAASLTTEGSVTVAARSSSGSVEFSVTDTGPGIERALHDAIFEKFRQVGGISGRARGTGLGLPICKQIISAHEGRIWVESEPNEGARFAFLLGRRGPTEVGDEA